MITTTKALDYAVEKILAQLLQDGKTPEKAWEFIAEKYQEALDLKEQVLTFGYSESEAYYIASQKLANSVTNQGIHELNYGKILPVSTIREHLNGGLGWHDMNDAQRKCILWDLGFNTRKFKWFINAGCFTYNGIQQCGVFVQGAERLDYEWLTMQIDGVNVASLEARFHNDREGLAVLQGRMKA